MKTFTPMFEGTAGPTELNAEDSIYEILYDINGKSGYRVNVMELERVNESLTKILNLDQCDDGIYNIFEDYQIAIKTRRVLKNEDDI